MSNITGEEGSLSSGEVQQLHQEQQQAVVVHDHSHGVAAKNISQQMPAAAKKKRNLPGTPGNSSY